MSATIKTQPVKSTRSPRLKVVTARAGRPKTLKVRVSSLTRPWALKSTATIVRALSGTALDSDTKIQVEIHKAVPAAKKRSGFVHVGAK